MLGSLMAVAPAEASSHGPLTWAPPELSDPTTVNVSPADITLELDGSRDYVVVMPDEPLESGLAITGGRNVVLVGGEIRVPWQGDDPWISQRRGLLLRDQTGVVHVEGLLITGEDLSEGIQIDAPEATVQLQNIRVEDVHARDQVGFSDNHPDVIQTWGGVAELRIDGLTGSTDYQGLFLAASSGSVGRADLRNVNIIGRETSRYLLWADGDFPRKVQNVYLQSAPGRGWAQTLWPNPDAWPGASPGSPPGGDFVKAGTVGVGYSTPGYVDGQSQPVKPVQEEQPEQETEPDQAEEEGSEAADRDPAEDSATETGTPPSLQIQPRNVWPYSPFEMALCVIDSLRLVEAKVLLWVMDLSVRPLCLI